jgi:pyrroline-5-carboxylate reductase
VNKAGIKMNIGIIGAGKMGEMIVQGLLRGSDSHQYKIEASTRSEMTAQEFSEKLKIPCGMDNLKLASRSDVILICTKPHQAEAIVRSIQSVLGASKLLISICASVSTTQLEEWSGGKTPVIRSMPNTPCMIGEGMTVLCKGVHSTQNHLNTAQRLFIPLGKTAVIEESLMDGATGLSGCGPAYVYMIIEALSEAGVKVGLPRKVATLLAAQTLSGAAQMVLQRGAHPAALKDEVTTPAGCTIDGLMALEEGKLRVTLIKAVLAATKRSRTRNKAGF